MTLGEHIQELRKASGLSQEALGERLGVTRQSISKWESDLAMPEVEKLVAMSRLFGVSMGALLQVEEEAGPLTGELTDRELKAVEAIVGRYVDDTQARREQRRKRWPFVLAGLALVIVFWVLFSRVGDLERQLNAVRTDVYRTTDGLSGELSRLTGTIQSILREENSLLAASSCQMDKAVLFDNGQPFGEFTVSVTPRQYIEGMSATFVMELDGDERQSVEAEFYSGGSPGFSVTGWRIPLHDSMKLSVILSQGEEKWTQAVEEFEGLKSATELEVNTLFQGGYTNYTGEGTASWEGTVTASVYQMPDAVLLDQELHPVEAWLAVERNGEEIVRTDLLRAGGEVPEGVSAVPMEWTGEGPHPYDTTFSTDLSGDCEAHEGDHIALMLHIRDNYGRITDSVVWEFTNVRP